mmetsp:Transcript_4273/g.8900  ORF Transcript_4273/g.8900 Transcript_4273/m.8900 type:complete len:405 (-) Transcript_4273:77-1291(-)
MVEHDKEDQKKRLKRQLKFDRRVNTLLQARIRHSVARGDPIVERQARLELEELVSTRLSTGERPSSSSQTTCPSTKKQRDAATKDSLGVFAALLVSIDSRDLPDEADKAERAAKTNQLCRNMTKATQSIEMFHDMKTLRGYARRKFAQRSALVADSLGKLHPDAIEMGVAAAARTRSEMDSGQLALYDEQIRLMKSCWSGLSRVANICSIGCGPGCDLVGTLTFLRHFVHECDSSSVEVGCRQRRLKAVLLDFAIEQWKEAVLDDLANLLRPDYVNEVCCCRCDVTRAMDDSIEQTVADVDLYLTSYLITETRFQWDEFFVDLVRQARVGALFYFVEPTPWQLHRLIRLSKKGSKASDNARTDVDYAPLEGLRFVWLDSSMHSPELQPLDGRVGGPAVLLAIKV